MTARRPGGCSDVDSRDAEWVPNGVDLSRFDRSETTPRGADGALAQVARGGAARAGARAARPGASATRRPTSRPFRDPASGGTAPVLLFVGRFTEVKRIPLLVRAYARAREQFERRAPLVIWGGFPGEWEGEHPHTVVESEEVEDVFFLGWRDHDELPAGLACSDLMVMPSIDESFGQVFVEAMACGVPVIAAQRGRAALVHQHRPGPPERLARRARRPGEPGGRAGGGGQRPRRARGARAQRLRGHPAGVLVGARSPSGSRACTRR